MSPKTLDELTHHSQVTQILRKISSTSDFPNLMFYGPPGAGKHTRIRCFLNELFDERVHDRKIENREYKITSKYVPVRISRSIYHVEITPSNYGVYDRVVIQEIIKEIAETPSITSFTKAKIKVKVVVIDQADHLTILAQNALRRTMEKYSRTCRIILCCENYSKIISPLRSRTLPVRVPAPTQEELLKILKSESIIKTRNIRKAQLMKISGIEKLEWEAYIELLAQDVVKGSPLIKIREYFYTLLTVGIPDNVIFYTLTTELIERKPDKVHQIIEHAQKYQYRSTLGQKPIYHLEAFVAKVQAEN